MTEDDEILKPCVLLYESPASFLKGSPISPHVAKTLLKDYKVGRIQNLGDIIWATFDFFILPRRLVNLALQIKGPGSYERSMFMIVKELMSAAVSPMHYDLTVKGIVDISNYIIEQSNDQEVKDPRSLENQDDKSRYNSFVAEVFEMLSDIKSYGGTDSLPVSYLMELKRQHEQYCEADLKTPGFIVYNTMHGHLEHLIGPVDSEFYPVAKFSFGNYTPAQNQEIHNMPEEFDIGEIINVIQQEINKDIIEVRT